ncbi:40S small subunit processome assembly factor 1 [Odontesthes bonariensis]|uniref:40S small subunit processome assembly factor 1 n=1 Tax=Odontesthes bonariensis TaxID=219752 RepID=UPI003F5861A8
MSSETNGRDDEDCSFLEHVLDKLYDFESAPKKKPQKKKKRKRCEEEEEEELPIVKDICSNSDDYRGEDAGTEHQQQQLKTEQTGPTIQQTSQVEVVTFQDPTKKLKTKQTPAPNKMPAPQISEKKQSDQKEELSLEKARLEVHRFGITGYRKEQQRIFEQDRAVMLGARPPKKEYVNYKVLQQQIKEKKQKAKEEVQLDKKKKKKKQSTQRDKKSSSGSGAAPSGHVGRFKNGMLVLSSKEIQKIKGKR